MTKKIKNLIIGSVWILLMSFSPSSWAKDNLPLEQLQLPKGFHIEIFAEGLKNPRKMALGDKGTVFVDSTDAAKVYAIVPDKKMLIFAL